MDVAAAAGVPQANLSRWESGKVRPSLESLVAVLNALEINFADLQAALDEAAGREVARRERSMGYYAPPVTRTARLGDPMLSLVADIDRRVSWLEQAFRMSGMLTGKGSGSSEQAAAGDDAKLKPERVQTGSGGD